jgi:hypothetical protein
LCAISEAGEDTANGGDAVIRRALLEDEEVSFGHDGNEGMRVSGIEKVLMLVLYD